MPSPFYAKSKTFLLRMLTAASNIADIGAGFAALGEDVDALLTGRIWETGDFRFTAAALKEGWLACEAQEVLGTTYPALATLLGTGGTSKYGAAAAGKIMMPDFRERVPVGAGATLKLGAKGGAATVALSVANLAAHKHGVTDPGHAHSMESLNAGGLPPNLKASGGRNYVEGATTGGGGNYSLPVPTSTGSFSYLIGVAPGSTGVSTNNEGSGTAHTNMQPYTITNVYIKT